MKAFCYSRTLKGHFQKGSLEKYEITRLTMGCNPSIGSNHARDLSYVGTLSRNYHTPTKLKETWAIGEKTGINLCNMVASQYPTFAEYRNETGSKLLTMCQCPVRSGTGGQGK